MTLPSGRCALRLRRSPVLAAASGILWMACASPAPESFPPAPPAGDVSAAAPLPVAGAERVALRFAWPEGFTARVVGAESRVLSSDDREDATRSELSYRVRIEPSGDGARIRYEEFALPGADSGALVPLRGVPGLENLADALRPSFVVGPNGRFLGTPDLDDTVAAVNRELDALHAGSGGLPSGAPALPTRFSAELFRRHAPVEWWPMVEMWAGREIHLGGRYTLDLTTRMPLLDGATLRMDGDLAVSGRRSCGDGGPPRCIELVLETRPDPLELIPLLGETGSRKEGAAGSAPVTVTKLDLRETVRLLTEPETLVPRRLETRQRALVTVRLPDGRLHTDTLDHAADLVFHPDT